MFPLRYCKLVYNQMNWFDISTIRKILGLQTLENHKYLFCHFGVILLSFFCQVCHFGFALSFLSFVFFCDFAVILLSFVCHFIVILGTGK